MNKNESEFIIALRKAGFSRALCESVNSIRKVIFENEDEPVENDADAKKFDNVGEFHEGYATVFKRDNQYRFLRKMNYIDVDGKLLSEDEWFDQAEPFSDGYAAVLRHGDGKWNFIGKDGKFMLNEGLDRSPSNFHEGFAMVTDDEGFHNFIDKEGKYLSDVWFWVADDFHEGYALVGDKDVKYNFINKEGKYLSNDWFDHADSFTKKGYARVERGEQYNYIDKKGNFMYDRWIGENSTDDSEDTEDANWHWWFMKDAKFENDNFEEILDKYNKTHDINLLHIIYYDEDEFGAGYGYSDVAYLTVGLGGKMNVIDENGDLMSEQWFDYIDRFDYDKEYTPVYVGSRFIIGKTGKYEENAEHKENLMDKHGKLLSPNKWFNRVEDFRDGHALVFDNDKGYNFIDKNGELMLKGESWGYNFCEFYGGYAAVQSPSNKKWNFINKDGELLWEKEPEDWFDEVHHFYEGYANVKLNGKWYKIDTEGKLHEE